MDYKTFGEEAEIEYTTIVTVNGETAGQVSSYSEDGLIEQYRKLDTAIANKLKEQYEDLPEVQNEND
jgi:hypothetical protein